MLDGLEEFVQQHPLGGFFQSGRAFRFFSSLEHFTPMLLTAQKDGRILGSLLCVAMQEGGGPKGFFSRRCIINGGPLVSEEAPDRLLVVEALLNQLNKDSRGIYTEFRNAFDQQVYKDVFEQAGYAYEPHLNYLVSIEEGAEESLKLLNSSKRRQVRKSWKNGASVREAQSLEEVRDFYEILKELYETKVKKPLPDYSFFRQFYEQGDAGKYFLVYKDEEVLGGIMCPIYRDTVYEWYIGGLDGRIKNVYPSVLATWAPIEYGAENGLKCFDFMGAGKPDDDYGVREFKSKFGGELVEFGRFIKINNPLLYSAGKAGLKLLQKLK